MTRQKNDQIPLGELLTKARLDAHISRAQLAKKTGISENSLTRYEKAGLESDGQYPPSPKLAALCFHLGISPMLALLGCVDYPDYWGFKGMTLESDVMDHPDHKYLGEENVTLSAENRKLRALLLILTGGNHNFDEDEARWLMGEVVEISKKRERIDKAIEKQYGSDGGMVVIPGIPAERWNEVYPDRECPYADQTENGPDQKDPDRPESSTNNPEAVGAASTNPTKGRTDEAV